MIHLEAWYRETVRPIPIEENLYVDIALNLMKAWRREDHPDEGTILLVGESSVTDVVGTIVPFKYGLRFRDMDTPIGEGIIGRTPEGSWVLYAEVSSKVSPDLLPEPSYSKLERYMVQLVLHEITHLKDVQAREAPLGQGDTEDYFNQPHEVRAFLSTVCHEILLNLHQVVLDAPDELRDPVYWNSVFHRKLSESHTWKEVSPHLNVRNRKQVLRGAWTCFQEAVRSELVDLKEFGL